MDPCRRTDSFAKDKICFYLNLSMRKFKAQAELVEVEAGKASSLRTQSVPKGP